MRDLVRRGLLIVASLLVVAAPGMLATPTVASAATATSTALSASPLGPSVFGQPITLTATVTGGDGGGTVDFYAAGITIGGCTTVSLSGPGPYTATCTVSGLPVGGPFVFEATYSGDASSLASEDAIPYAVDKASTKTSVVGSTDLSSFGDPVTFTATVAVVAPGAGAPSGSVAFTADGSPIAGCEAQPLSASSPFTATCTTSSLSVGTGNSHSITAIYGGDVSFAGSASDGLLGVAVFAHPTTTTLSASPASQSTVGQPVTFTAMVSPGNGDGTVSFSSDGTAIAGCGAQSLSGSGPYTATCTTSALSAAGSPHSIVADYGGDPVLGEYFPSESTPALSYTVIDPTTSTALAAVPAGSSVFGQSVALTATVTGGDGGGTVAFTAGGNPIGGCGAVGLSGPGPYTATCTVSGLPVGGPFVFDATYSGDTSFLGSAASIPYTVSKASTATTLSASPVGSSTVGQSVTFTATVAVVAPGAGAPSGSVAFTADGSPIAGCTARALAASGPHTATCTTSALSVAGSPHSIVATYGGDGNFLGSASAALPYTVNKASTTTTLTASPASPATFGQKVTFTAAVAAVAPGAGSPSGTVAFTVDGAAIGSSTLSGSSQASFATSSLSAGTHTIAAAYSGDGNFLPSASGNLPYAVTCAVTITGSHSGLDVTTSTCVAAGASVTGSVVVHGAGTLDLEGATVNGAVLANGGSGAIRICNSSISGGVDIENQTGLVIVGDPGDARCAPNTIGGSFILKGNTGGVEAINNTVHGSVLTSNNSGPGPFPGDPTTISGNGP